MNEHVSKWIESSKDRPGASGSRVITPRPYERDAQITTFLRDGDGTCYCMTSGRFISEGEICYLQLLTTTMSELKNVHADHLDYKNNYLKLGECVLSINEVPDFIVNEVDDIWGKMDVALIKVYEDVVQHLHLALRDKEDTKTRVVVRVPNEDLNVKHCKYGRVHRGKVREVDSKHGLFYIRPSEVAEEQPGGDRGALICKRHNRYGYTKVFGMLVAYECFKYLSYHPIALQIDRVIERVEREMNGKADGLQFYMYTPL